MSVVVEASMIAELYCPSCESSFTAGARCTQCATKLVKLVAATEHGVAGHELDGRFTVLEQLGHGAMGAVFRAKQHSVNREVAIKIVHADRISDPIVIKRFLREAKLLSRLSHPNAVGVLDFGQTDDGVFYVVMELVAGRTLDEELRQVGPFEPARVVKIGAQICDALETAHGLQIVHRDLKPANIMLMNGADDFVKVLDFGLAKSLADDTESTDGRADLYSLGCILFLLATGELPFHSDSTDDTLSRNALRPPPQMEGVPAALAQVVEQLLAHDPKDRYQTATEVRQALEVALASLAIDGELHRGPERYSPATGSVMIVSDDMLAAAIPMRRRVWPYIVVGLASAVLTAGIIGFSMTMGDSGASPDPETRASASTAPSTSPTPSTAPTTGAAAAASPDDSGSRNKRPRPEDELAEPGAPPRTVGNGTEGALAAQAPAEAKPVAPEETKPVAPPETKPIAPPPETKPVAPLETKPVAPTETKPVAPPETKPAPRPAAPVEVKPAVQPKPAPPAPPPAPTPAKPQKIEVKKPPAEVPKKPPPPPKKPVRRVRATPPPRAAPTAPAQRQSAPAPESPPEPKLPF